MKKKIKDDELPNQYILINGNKVSVEDYRRDPSKYNKLKPTVDYLNKVKDGIDKRNKKTS